MSENAERPAKSGRGSGQKERPTASSVRSRLRSDIYPGIQTSFDLLSQPDHVDGGAAQLGAREKAGRVEAAQQGAVAAEAA